MEPLLIGTKLLLVVLVVWSAVIMFSIAKMMVTVRSFRGTNRRVDWVEGLLSFGVFASSVALLWNAPMEMTRVCTFGPSFAIVSLFLLFYMSQRHVQNLRNITALKKTLTKQ